MAKPASEGDVTPVAEETLQAFDDVTLKGGENLRQMIQYRC